MYKSKLAILIDSVICAVISLLLSFSWINKCIKNAFLSLFLANIISLLIFICIFLHFSKQHKQNKLSSEESNLLQNSLNKLTFSSIDFQINYFCKLLNCTYINQNFYLNNNYYFYINTGKVLSSEDFYKINNFYLNNSSEKPLVVLSLSASDEFLNLASNSPIKYPLFFKDDLFEIMKLNNGFLFSKSSIKPSLISKIKQFFKSLSRVKFKNLFSSGASLILLSFFIPYSYLYLTIGSVLLIFSFISLCSKNKTKEFQSELSVKDLIKK